MSHAVVVTAVVLLLLLLRSSDASESLMDDGQAFLQALVELANDSLGVEQIQVGNPFLLKRAAF